MTASGHSGVIPCRSRPVQINLHSGLTRCYALSHRFPLSAMDQHLTLSEARAFTGKSESTLKRVLREIVGSPNHPDRPFILPTPEEIERRKAINEPYVWKIDRQLLLRKFPPDEPGRSGNDGSTGTPVTSAPADIMLKVLQEQLGSKDQQIRTLETQLDRKDEQIANLNSRMQESNVLMRELQQRLALPFPKPADSSEPVETKPVTPQPPRPAASQKKPAAKPTMKSIPRPSPKQKGFFGRLFHRLK